MEKPLEIKRIDLLVHPFYYRETSRKQFYGREGARSLLNLWKKHIDEVAKDPNRLLFITPQGLGFGQGEKKAVTDRQMRSQMQEQLVEYAERKLGKRLAFFAEPGLAVATIKDCRGRVFDSFKEYKEANRFKLDLKSLKTRGLGEYTNYCVADYLTALNMVTGMKNIIPYRNRQSTILARKSVSGSEKEYPRPWELKDLNKTREGRERLFELMEKYLKKRREKANGLARKYGKHYFKERKAVSEMRRRGK
ncbi:MAG: hypothetical protein JW744_05610 [Candidatus Diapherotrites archaeon]|uniref:Uncharacterized protein n=1 Tax=Candidatus Iainarchaeum sp. TaxID=3101447 RepID=A0A938YYY7_9ARCH|nr:hypothetical protein [Candidatus Diapherotrites archaeon]